MRAAATIEEVIARHQRVIKIEYGDDHHLLGFGSADQENPTWVYHLMPHVSPTTLRPADSVWIYHNQKSLRSRPFELVR